jgi:hypothetical protein
MLAPKTIKFWEDAPREETKSKRSRQGRRPREETSKFARFSELKFSEVGTAKMGLKNSPILVETTSTFLIDVLSPDSLKSTETTRSFNVADNTDTDHWGRFNDSNGLNNLTAALGSRSVDLTDDMGHTSLVAQKYSQVDRLGRVILGESLNPSTMSFRAAFGIESHGAVTRRRKLSVRLKKKFPI